MATHRDTVKRVSLSEQCEDHRDKHANAHSESDRLMRCKHKSLSEETEAHTRTHTRTHTQRERGRQTDGTSKGLRG